MFVFPVEKTFQVTKAWNNQSSHSVGRSAGGSVLTEL